LKLLIKVDWNIVGHHRQEKKIKNLPYDEYRARRPMNSERSEECIDFTMICIFFFVSMCSITSRNNSPISNFEGCFRCKSEYPWCIIEVKS
ncbi:Uncharacterized protein FWK35_00025295, partial [Aphis craccivora]